MFAVPDDAKAVKAKIAAAVLDANSPLGTALIGELNRHVANSQWDGSEIYTGSSYRVRTGVLRRRRADSIDGEINI